MLHLVVVIVTLAVNVPLNDDLKAAGNPAIIEVSAAREAFQEARWVAWNWVLVVLDVGAFGALGVALVAHGKAAG